MSVRITVETEIAAPPDTVWAAIEDLGTHTEWMADAERITFVTDQRAGVGTAFDCLTVVGPLRTTDRMTITEWEPGAVMGIEHHGAVTGSGRFTLAPSAGGTRFRWSEELTFPWWMGGTLGEVAGRPVLTRVWRRNLARLHDHVLGRPPQTAAVDRTVDLPAPADAVWAAARAVPTFRTVTRGLLGYPVVRDRHDDWRAGETVVGWLLAGGVVPVWRHELHVDAVDDPTRTLRTRERGGLLRRWDHTITVVAIDDTRSRYRDHVAIDAGPLTPVAVMVADGLFRVRQVRWRRLTAAPTA